MIKIIVFKDCTNQYKGFDISGHAGYDAYGKDIICSAVSVLSQNAVNSIESFTKDKFNVNIEQSGDLWFRFIGNISRESILLLDSMILGFSSVREAYGSQYIEVLFEEV